MTVECGHVNKYLELFHRSTALWATFKYLCVDQPLATEAQQSLYQDPVG